MRSPGSWSVHVVCARLAVDVLASFHHSIRSGSRKDQTSGGVGRPPHTFDGLVGVLFSTVRHAYSSPPSLPGSVPFENEKTGDSGSESIVGCDGVGCDLTGDENHSRGQCWLAPGCDDGFGGGMLDLGLAEQCSSLLRVLYEVRLTHCTILECTLSADPFSLYKGVSLACA